MGRSTGRRWGLAEGAGAAADFLFGECFPGGSRKRCGKCFQAEAGSEAENVFRFRPDGTQDKDLPVENRKEEI